MIYAHEVRPAALEMADGRFKPAIVTGASTSEIHTGSEYVDAASAIAAAESFIAGNYPVKVIYKD